MRWLAVFVTLLGSTSAMAAPDCTFEQAIYTQPDGRQLQFQPVPRDAPANQTASFILTLRAGQELTGAIMWPNGYSTPLWSAEGPCAPDDKEVCQFGQEENNTTYILGDAGIERLPQEMDGPPARQVLLPRLSSSLWYSFYRDSEFDLDEDSGDVFTFSGCAN